MSENSAGPGEPVRLPGIIHIEEEDINCKLNMLTVDTSDIGQSRFKQKPSWMSPYSRLVGKVTYYVLPPTVRGWTVSTVTEIQIMAASVFSHSYF